MIVLAFIETLGSQGPIGSHMPTNCTVSIQMKIEMVLLNGFVSGPLCHFTRLRAGPPLRHWDICYTSQHPRRI